MSSAFKIIYKNPAQYFWVYIWNFLKINSPESKIFIYVMTFLCSTYKQNKQNFYEANQSIRMEANMVSIISKGKLEKRNVLHVICF